MKRKVQPPENALDDIQETVEYVDARLSSNEETATVVQETLVDMFGDRDEYERYLSDESVSPMTRMRVQSYNPDNCLTESEYWAEQDPSLLRESKYLQFLWRGFDLSPMSNNISFAIPFRRMLAEHLFDEVGEDVKLFGGIKIQCGHNIQMGDNVVVHNDVLLDDRGRLEIGDSASIADRSHIHTHNHDLVEQSDVTTYRTIIEDNARLGYSSMVGSGCRVGENAIVGASAMVYGDVPNHHVATGSPAKTIKVKPGWEGVADNVGPLPDNREERILSREIPEDIEPFDEFERDLSPPETG
jgi:maltose O-acetyltransferase